jgi:hypothetical protein
MNESQPIRDDDSRVKDEDAEASPAIVEGADYYLEGGLMVFTERFLLRRGYCCESGCRHCPYGFGEKSKEQSAKGKRH